MKFKTGKPIKFVEVGELSAGDLFRMGEPYIFCMVVSIHALDLSKEYLTRFRDYVPVVGLEYGEIRWLSRHSHVVPIEIPEVIYQDEVKT